MGKRKPEEEAPAEFFFNDDRASKYNATRAVNVQTTLTERALEMMGFPDDGIPRLLLDIGCGTGLSGQTLRNKGHHWIGVDISKSMLDVAVENEVDGDLLLRDIGQGLGLRAGVMDGAVSISVVQWLLQAGKTCHDPYKRLKSFFDSLYKCLAPGGKAVLQVYSSHVSQGEILITKALRSGFAGCLVTDYPSSALARKVFLFLVVPGIPFSMPGIQDGIPPPEYYEDEQGDATVRDGIFAVSVGRRVRKKQKKVEVVERESMRQYVMRKKAKQRACGMLCVRNDSKYSGRKRKSRRF